MKNQSLVAVLDGQPVLPVLVINRLSDAVPLAQALMRGGLPAIEITLRTRHALDAIRLIADEAPEIIVGAGTVRNAIQFQEAAAAGSRFIVSPGTTQELIDAANISDVPFLPGVATPSEAMAMLEEGLTMMKFFPAEPAGGADYLKALASPLAEARFCPTGGITRESADRYLALPNVVCVGGSWVAPADLVENRDWQAIEDLAREAARLRRA
ncbi:2-dehydro-3-deoxy-phosphogluconate aldolase [Chelativorans sp. ZYF759]|uniref:2-dehydro-3-deoxy-phosphogluconate aldolase n=1 Tax=Chelativorans sp. ZYF759 TaxID=2692213 RepID=UPI00145E3DB2|nr:2-dehydro-3-deoxy-phosphogluconate aldolase [Chelativorans sp. ZYF759]NMG40288.1 2-dehydro-3-deoxy-phosphogluconate aldolase [Chelativorans sp. ZYF759]